jgi:hypothetical protein
MQKVYFLLRNNVHMGPYNLSELEQQSWQPNDLIWIEGESTSWSAPPGIAGQQSQNNKQQNVLQKPGAPDSVQRRIWVQMPRAENPVFERDELRSNVSSPKNIQPVTNVPERRLPGRKTEREEVELIIHKNTSNTVSLVQLITIVGITFLAVLAWKSNFTITPQKENITYAVKPVVFSAEPPPVKPNNTVTPTREDTSKVVKEEVPPVLTSLDQKKVTVKKPAKTGKALVAPPPPSEGAPSFATTDATKSSTEATLKEEVPPSEEFTSPPPESTNTNKPEKKKTFGQAIRGLFKKNKRNESKAEDGSAPD